jgi:hypothetical protein
VLTGALSALVVMTALSAGMGWIAPNLVRHRAVPNCVQSLRSAPGLHLISFPVPLLRRLTSSTPTSRPWAFSSSSEYASPAAHSLALPLASLSPFRLTAGQRVCAATPAGSLTATLRGRTASWEARGLRVTLTATLKPQVRLIYENYEDKGKAGWEELAEVEAELSSPKRDLESKKSKGSKSSSLKRKLGASVPLTKPSSAASIELRVHW